MELIAILFALLAERGLSQLREWRERAWYATYLDWLNARLQLPWLFGSPKGLLLLLAAPLLVVGAIQCLLNEGVLSLIGLFFATFVLVFTLGPRDLGEEVRHLLDARALGDKEDAALIQADLARLPPGVQAENEERAVVLGIFVQGHERLLGLLFWFFVLGPFGAALYRLSASLPTLLAQRESDAQLRSYAHRLHAGLAWLPARITAGLYTLAGSTDDALSEWRAHINAGEPDWTQRSWQLLARIGCGALQMEDGDDGHPIKLDFEEALEESLSLVRRALLLGLAVIAILTIGGLIA